MNRLSLLGDETCKNYAFFNNEIESRVELQHFFFHFHLTTNPRQQQNISFHEISFFSSSQRPDNFRSFVQFSTLNNVECKKNRLLVAQNHLRRYQEFRTTQNFSTIGWHDDKTRRAHVTWVNLNLSLLKEKRKKFFTKI